MHQGFNYVFGVFNTNLKAVIFGFFCICLITASLAFCGTLLFSVVLVASQETGLFSLLLRKVREGACCPMVQGDWKAQT